MINDEYRKLVRGTPTPEPYMSTCRHFGVSRFSRTKTKGLPKGRHSRAHY